MVADATWGEPAMRSLASDLATATSSRVMSIECRAPIELAVARAQRRLAAGHDASEAGGDVARRLAEQRAPWPDAVTIETDANVEQSLRHALTAVTMTQEISARLTG